MRQTPQGGQTRILRTQGIFGVLQTVLGVVEEEGNVACDLWDAILRTSKKSLHVSLEALHATPEPLNLYYPVGAGSNGVYRWLRLQPFPKQRSFSMSAIS